jgi:oligopeptide transport system ATP-binding protein
MNVDSPLLEVKDLRVHFHTLDGIVRAVNGITYSMNSGESLGIVGESGCGKSVSVLSIMRLIKEPPGEIVAGSIRYHGEDLLKMGIDQIQSIRGKEIAMIFQDPMTSFNPVLTIGRQISEVLIEHLKLNQSDARKKVNALLDMVEIPQASTRYSDYPHQFSGGMRQRAMIAMALACNPSILIADEPTTALDVTIQAQIIDLIKVLRDQINMAVIWITHDLAVVAEIADRVIVMYAGYIVEEANIFSLYERPLHPYTLSLLKSLPRVDVGKREKLLAIPGFPPNCIDLPSGCPFSPRCTFAINRCFQENPKLEIIEENHKTACWIDITTGLEK